jgi:hypothetical protein
VGGRAWGGGPERHPGRRPAPSAPRELPGPRVRAAVCRPQSSPVPSVLLSAERGSARLPARELAGSRAPGCAAHRPGPRPGLPGLTPARPPGGRRATPGRCARRTYGGKAGNAPCRRHRAGGTARSRPRARLPARAVLRSARPGALPVLVVDVRDPVSSAVGLARCCSGRGCRSGRPDGAEMTEAGSSQAATPAEDSGGGCSWLKLRVAVAAAFVRAPARGRHFALFRERPGHEVPTSELYSCDNPGWQQQDRQRSPCGASRS